jgi:hypothetical protein
MDTSNNKFYELFIYVEPNLPELKQLYIDAAITHNLMVENYLNALTNNRMLYIEPYCCFKPAFDLFCPQDTNFIGSQKVVIDHRIITSMKINNCYISYYLYAITKAYKSPLRVANSVSIIQSYNRTSLQIVFDHMLDYYDLMNHKIIFGSKLLQISPPNIEYPMKINIVDDIESLGVMRHNMGMFMQD